MDKVGRGVLIHVGKGFAIDTVDFKGCWLEDIEIVGVTLSSSLEKIAVVSAYINPEVRVAQVTSLLCL